MIDEIKILTIEINTIIMRRAKIKPSINLAASRRSSQVVKPDSKAKNTPSNSYTPTETGIPIADHNGSSKAKNSLEVSKPQVPSLEFSKPQVTSPRVSKPQVTSPKVSKPQVASPEVSKPLVAVQQVSKPQLSCTKPITAGASGDKSSKPLLRTESEEIATNEQELDTSSKVGESPTAPSQSKESLNPQRRRKFSAKPNLGQNRMRLPLPSRKEKTSVISHQNTANGTSESCGAIANADSDKPFDPPNVRRVVPVSLEKSAAVLQNKHVVDKPQKNIREILSTSTQPKPQMSKPTVHPKSTQQPSRPERLVEKRGALPPTIQDKRLRDLKALETETPAKRRKRYIKKTSPPDRSKMTMSDLIYYNPKANPMKSSLESQEKAKPNNNNNDDNNVKEKPSVVNAVDEVAEEESNQMAPQVRIDADGKIVIDKDSLTIEASPARTFVTENAEVVHEDQSNVTYASFRKRTHTSAWTKMETERFFLALSMVGTDFTMVNALFPKRTRHQIKNKFKREERMNRTRIDKAIREKQRLDRSMFEASEDSDEESVVGVTITKGKKRGPKQAATSKEKRVEDEESEFNENLLDNNSDQDGSDVEVTNILARPTRSGRIPKVRIDYANIVEVDDEEEETGAIVREIGSSPLVNGNVQKTPGGLSPGKSGHMTPAQGTPTTPMQTVYVVTPLQGGKQFMIRQHNVPQPSPDSIQAALAHHTGGTTSQFQTGGQSPLIQLQHRNSPATSTLQLRMPSPQNPINSPTGSHTVLKQKVGNTEIIVMSPARGGPGSSGQVDFNHPLSTGVQNTLHTNNTPPVHSANQRTFIRIQPGDIRMSPNNTAISVQQHQTANSHTKRRPTQTLEVALNEPFVPPSMKPKSCQRDSANKNLQKVIVQSLPQSLESDPEVLLLDDVSLAAQTEVVSEVVMEVEAECTN
ncbi:uncharacterized protein [Antedon mediterranea]|uniref:uncharacterized protein n=1 Tax=Antedon mediterranea TaxID=105859 RepID=UPI003AF7D8B0